MFQILSLLVLISAIGYMVSVRGKVKTGQAVDQLSGGEKLYIWITCLLNPVFSGAVFYYGWKKLLPQKAKQANSISLWAFFLEIVIGVLILFLTSGGK